MVDITYKKKGLKINTIWFSNDIEKILSRSKSDLVFFHGVDCDKYEKSIINVQYSLKTDLKIPKEEIFKGFNKNYKYEINRAKKENVECTIYNYKELINNTNLLIEFKKEYNEFVKLKGIELNYNEIAMQEYIKNKSVILTKASKNGVDYAQHIYVCDGETARLLYSVSNFRTEGLDSNLIGRANKYLHWFDIEYLCDNNFRTLDWGGVSSLESPNGIDKFKKGFGGYECKYNNMIIGNSIIGKIAINIIKLKRS